MSEMVRVAYEGLLASCLASSEGANTTKIVCSDGVVHGSALLLSIWSDTIRLAMSDFGEEEVLVVPDVSVSLMTKLLRWSRRGEVLLTNAEAKDVTTVLCSLGISVDFTIQHFKKRQLEEEIVVQQEKKIVNVDLASPPRSEESVENDVGLGEWQEEDEVIDISNDQDDDVSEEIADVAEIPVEVQETIDESMDKDIREENESDFSQHDSEVLVENDVSQDHGLLAESEECETPTDGSHDGEPNKASEEPFVNAKPMVALARLDNKTLAELSAPQEKQTDSEIKIKHVEGKSIITEQRSEMSLSDAQVPPSFDVRKKKKPRAKKIRLAKSKDAKSIQSIAKIKTQPQIKVIEQVEPQGDKTKRNNSHHEKLDKVKEANEANGLEILKTEATKVETISLVHTKSINIMSQKEDENRKHELKSQKDQKSRDEDDKPEDEQTRTTKEMLSLVGMKEKTPKKLKKMKIKKSSNNGVRKGTGETTKAKENKRLKRLVNKQDNVDKASKKLKIEENRASKDKAVLSRMPGKKQEELRPKQEVKKQELEIRKASRAFVSVSRLTEKMIARHCSSDIGQEPQDKETSKIEHKTDKPVDIAQQTEKSLSGSDLEQNCDNVGTKSYASMKPFEPSTSPSSTQFETQGRKTYAEVTPHASRRKRQKSQLIMLVRKDSKESNGLFDAKDKEHEESEEAELKDNASVSEPPTDKDPYDIDDSDIVAEMSEAPGASSKRQRETSQPPETKPKMPKLESEVESDRGHPNRCPLCEKSYRNLHGLKQHLCDAHFRAELFRIGRAGGEEDSSECGICGKHYEGVYFARHVGMKHKGLAEVLPEGLNKRFLGPSQEEDNDIGVITLL